MAEMSNSLHCRTETNTSKRTHSICDHVSVEQFPFVRIGTPDGHFANGMAKFERLITQESFEFLQNVANHFQIVP